jgi:predicted ATPase
VIQSVQFRNFKAYRSLDLDLEPFTVLVGPNASGKTTLLEGLRMLATHVAPYFHQTMRSDWVPDGMISFGATQPAELAFHGRWKGTVGRIRVRSAPKDGMNAGSNVADWEASSQQSSAPKASSLIHLLTPRPSQDINAVLMATKIMRFDLRMLAAASYSEDSVPVVESDGAGLASTLAYLKLSHDELFAGIENALRQVVPAVRRIRIERAAVEQSSIRTLALDGQETKISERHMLWGNRLVLDMQGARGIPADSAGEGTLMVLGLLTVLMGPQKPRLLLLDDIELSLHPMAQGRLVEILRSIQRDDPELQIVATSHSPFILNYLEPREVRMTFLAENGFARCEKLTAHPEFEKWKDLMSPGEFWSTMGESWIGKVPASTPNE